MTFSGYIFLIILIFIPLLLSKINKPKLFQQHSIAFISATIAYIMIIGLTVYNSYQTEIILNACDLNHNGSFSIQEMTPECQKAMHNFIDDTGRNFTAFTGLIFSLFYFFIIKSIIFIINKIHKQGNA